jgi:hypothetical protein
MTEVELNNQRTKISIRTLANNVKIFFRLMMLTNDFTKKIQTSHEILIFYHFDRLKEKINNFKINEIFLHLIHSGN